MVPEAGVVQGGWKVADGELEPPITPACAGGIRSSSGTEIGNPRGEDDVQRLEEKLGNDLLDPRR